MVGLMWKRVRRALPVLVILVGIVVVVIVGKLAMGGGEASSQGRAAAGRGKREGRVVVVERVQPTNLAQSLDLNGTLRASESVDLRSEIAGRVASIHFTDGQSVKKGDLLVRIDARELVAELTAARTKLQLAEQTERRQTSLMERGLVSQQEYDKAVSERAVLAAQASLLGVRSGKAAIRAPFDGRVGLRQVSPGEMVTQNTLIVNVRRLDPLHLDFSVPERYQGQVGVGMELTLTVEGVEGQFAATVVAIDPQVDEATRMLQMRALVQNPHAVLLPGNFARVSLVLKQFDGAMMVPSTAIESSLYEAAVFVVDDGGLARRRVVTLGLRDEERVQVLTGLAVGDRVVVRGIGMVDGAPVRVVEGSAISKKATQEPAAEKTAPESADKAAGTQAHDGRAGGQQ